MFLLWPNSLATTINPNPAIYAIWLEFLVSRILICHANCISALESIHLSYTHSFPAQVYCKGGQPIFRSRFFRNSTMLVIIPTKQFFRALLCTKTFSSPPWRSMVQCTTTKQIEPYFVRIYREEYSSWSSFSFRTLSFGPFSRSRVFPMPVKHTRAERNTIGDFMRSALSWSSFSISGPNTFSDFV